MLRGPDYNLNLSSTYYSSQIEERNQDGHKWERSDEIVSKANVVE